MSPQVHETKGLKTRWGPRSLREHHLDVRWSTTLTRRESTNEYRRTYDTVCRVFYWYGYVDILCSPI
jgi:hypothetical protein